MIFNEDVVSIALVTDLAVNSKVHFLLFQLCMFVDTYLLTASLYCLFPHSDKPYSMPACYTHTYTSTFTLVQCFRQQLFIRWCVPLVQSGHLY